MAQCVHVFDRVLVGHTYVNIRVEILELVQRCLSATDLPDVFLPAVEVTADVLGAHLARIVDSHLFWTSQNEVLRNLDPQLHLNPDLPQKFRG